MSTPTSDSAAIRQVIRALKAADIRPTYVEYGGGDGVDITPTSTEQEIIDAIMAVDDAYLIVQIPANWADETHPGHPAGRTSHIRFVLGNDPEEVVCDHGVSLSPVLDPLTASWWD